MSALALDSQNSWRTGRVLKIFISYRRDDSAGWAGRVYDRVSHEFGADAVFMDVEGIRPGENFDTAILENVRGADVALVLVGPNWLAPDPATGLRRIDRADDWVRREIETALSTGSTVIPLLVQGARSPRKNDLPASLAELARKETVSLQMGSFQDDLDRLVPEIQSRDPWRPFKAPADRPMADFVWSDALMVHWRVSRADLLPHLPAGFELDEYDGSPWVSADAVGSADINLRMLARLLPAVRAVGRTVGRIPNVANVTQHPILNLKTYVTQRDRPGMLVLRMFMASGATMNVGKLLTRLPYRHAPFHSSRDGDERRIAMNGARAGAFRAAYQPDGEPFIVRPDTFEAFVHHRYVTYAGAAGSNDYRMFEMQYSPWTIQAARMRTLSHSLFEPLDIKPIGEPVTHAARRLTCTAWPVRRLNSLDAQARRRQ